MTRLSRSGPLLLVTAVIVLLLGLALAIGGAWLIALAGSWYYLLAGLGLVASGLLLAFGRALALWLYALVLLGSTLWALVEVGLDRWQLLPRLDVWLVLACWLCLPFVNRRLGRIDVARRAIRDAPLRGARWALGVSVAVTLAVGLASLTRSPHDHPGALPAVRMKAARTATAPFTPRGDWVGDGHSGHGDRYSPARRITPGNVGHLAPAWTFHTGDVPGPGGPLATADEVAPLEANGMLYLCTPHSIAIALDPDSGHPIWRFDPKTDRAAQGYQHMACRGLAYYDSGAYAAQAAAMGLPADRALAAAASAPTPPGAVAPTAIKLDTCPRRIFASTANATVVAINADNGQPCGDFGDNGTIALYHGQPLKQPGYLNPISPPTVTRHVLIVGAGAVDNASANASSGVVRGYDIDTGRLLWNWDPLEPGQTRPLPAGQTYAGNAANAWGQFSVDEKLGLVYLSMGNQTPGFRGGRHDPQGEQYRSLIVALDIARGKPRWVYQTVHHDLWNPGVGGQPTLVDLDTPAGKVPALVASTRRGDIYVLDRRDGRLLVPAPERPVPQGADPGDQVAATQPFSALSFLPQRLRESDMWGTTPYDQLICRIEFRTYRYDGVFTVPSAQGSLVYPGGFGVFGRGGIAIDPVRQVAILAPNDMAFVAKLYPREQAAQVQRDGSRSSLPPMKGTPFAVRRHALLSPLGVPCQAPPWGYLAAVDLTTMKSVWMHPNGTTEDQAPWGIALPLGVPSLGAPLVTAGGVAFLSGTPDAYLRAYDVATGKQLWQARLPAAGQGTPISYVSGRSGRQYVVVMAGGQRSPGTPVGDAVIAYALPVP